MLGLAADPSRLLRYTRSMDHALTSPMREPVLREATEQSVERYMSAMRSRFSLASGGDGTWKDLAPATKLARLRKSGTRYKREKGVTHADRLLMAAGKKLPILMDTGRLFASLYPDAPGYVSEATMARLMVGTKVPYAIFHQKGGEVPGQPPQREIFVAPSADVVDRMGDPIRLAVGTISRDLIQQAIAA